VWMVVSREKAPPASGRFEAAVACVSGAPPRGLSVRVRPWSAERTARVHTGFWSKYAWMKLTVQSTITSRREGRISRSIEERLVSRQTHKARTRPFCKIPSRVPRDSTTALSDFRLASN
jgi:hypothetical protein